MADERKDDQQQEQAASSEPYGILKLERDASLEEIQQRYKFLSRIFHPDKQRHEEDRAGAQEIFVLFKNAYDILVDPVLRQTYDYAGNRGVKIVRLTIHSQDPDALYPTLVRLHQHGMPRKALKYIKEAIQEVDIEKHNNKTRFSSTLEFPLTVDYMPDDDNRVLSAPELDEVRINVNFTPVSSSKWSMVVGGSTHTKNGKGDASGSIGVTYKPVSGTSIQTELDLTDPFRCSIATSRQLADRTVVTTTLRTAVPDLSKPGSSFSSFGGMQWSLVSHRVLFENQLRATWVLGMGVGQRNRPAVALQYGLLSFTTLFSDEYPEATVKLNFGMNPYPFKCSVKKELQDDRVVSGSWQWSPRVGVQWKVMLERAITSYATFSLGIHHGTLEGLTWLLQMKRGDVTLRVPITITSAVESASYGYQLLYWFFLSALLDEALGEIINDVTATKVAKAVHQESALHKVDKSPEEAQQQVKMMAHTAEVKRQREIAVDGLVILKATYFVEESHLVCQTNGNETTTLDVTVPLQFWVTGDSKLSLPSTPKSHLLGFHSLMSSVAGDQASTSRSFSLRRLWLGEQRQLRQSDKLSMPQLRVRYRHQGETFEITIDDNEALTLPAPNALRLGSLVT